MNTVMTERPEVEVVLRPTNLDNLMSPEYAERSKKLLRAHRAAPVLVDSFIRATNRIELAWQSGDLAGAVRELIQLRDTAKEYEL